jgi:hypothetical protein
LLDSGEERFGGLGPKTPEFLSVSRRDGTRIDMAPFGAAIFLRTSATPPGDGTNAEALER